MQTDQASLSERVQIVLADALRVPPEQVTADLHFGDLPQWDSMGHMEVMMLLDEKFGVEINADTIADLTSIPNICAYLEAHDLAQE